MPWKETAPTAPAGAHEPYPVMTARAGTTASTGVPPGAGPIRATETPAGLTAITGGPTAERLRPEVRAIHAPAPRAVVRAAADIPGDPPTIAAREGVAPLPGVQAIEARVVPPEVRERPEATRHRAGLPEHVLPEAGADRTKIPLYIL